MDDTITQEMFAHLVDLAALQLDASEAEYLRQQLQGSFEGIGATVEMQNGRLTIIAPIKGSPAEQAGLQAGDVILQVDDTVIQNMDVMQAIALIRGQKGTQVHLRVQRGSQPAFPVTITRNTINVPEVEAKMLDNDTVAYIQLSEFGDKATTELHAALADAAPTHLDLLRLPGQFLPDERAGVDAAVEVRQPEPLVGAVRIVVVLPPAHQQDIGL